MRGLACEPWEHWLPCGQGQSPCHQQPLSPSSTAPEQQQGGTRLMLDLQGSETQVGCVSIGCHVGRVPCHEQPPSAKLRSTWQGTGIHDVMSNEAWARWDRHMLDLRGSETQVGCVKMMGCTQGSFTQAMCSGREEFEFSV